ncbi:MAG: hypothetical protein JST89_04105 [Cyanobacteria bacterium SZAS-4]|nr:hypothetical protein [Cyanobacteria bacterium SZAS-4]
MQLTQSQYLLASDPSTAPVILRVLSAIDEPIVRARVAENPNCPSELLSVLLRDHEPSVRLGLIYNPNVSEEILDELASDRSFVVVYALAKNDKMPFALLKKLAEHPNEFIAARALTTLQDLHRELARAISSNMRSFEGKFSECAPYGKIFHIHSSHDDAS